MARNMYGATSADFTLTSGGRVVPGATLTVWSARTGGTQVTDLLDVNSVACTTVTSGADGSVVFYGPNNEKSTLWLDSGQGSRIAVRPVDITGATPSLTIGTVTTGTAAATLTGTDEDPVLSLVLPSAGVDGVNTAAIQAKAVTAAKIADDTITATQIAANAVGASELADASVTAAKLAVQPGNLLTENQSKPTTTGAYPMGGCTESVAGVFTATSADAFAAVTVLPVTPGDVVTAASTLVTVGRSALMLLEFRTAGNANVGGYPAGNVIAAGKSGESRLTITVPATAATVRVHAVYSGTGAAGDTVTLTNATFHRGAAGVWQLPGVPIPGQSRIAVNNAVDLSGTGSPEGVVTAAPGSTWLQTDATTDVKGWIKWIKATGTGNTGWVVGPEADTGLRDVSALIPAAHLALNPNAKMWLRRTGSLVTVAYHSGASPTATGLQTLTNTTTLPVGFRFSKSTSGLTPAAALIDSATGAGSAVSIYASSSSLISSGLHVSGTRVQGSISWTTDDAFPSSLPGSAA